MLISTTHVSVISKKKKKKKKEKKKKKKKKKKRGDTWGCFQSGSQLGGEELSSVSVLNDALLFPPRPPPPLSFLPFFLPPSIHPSFPPSFSQHLASIPAREKKKKKENMPPVAALKFLSGGNRERKKDLSYLTSDRLTHSDPAPSAGARVNFLPPLLLLPQITPTWRHDKHFPPLTPGEAGRGGHGGRRRRRRRRVAI